MYKKPSSSCICTSGDMYIKQVMLNTKILLKPFNLAKQNQSWSPKIPVILVTFEILGNIQYLHKNETFLGIINVINWLINNNYLPIMG